MLVAGASSATLLRIPPTLVRILQQIHLPSRSQNYFPALSALSESSANYPSRAFPWLL